MDFTTRYYQVMRIEGDYAYLLEEAQDGVAAAGAEEKCVARALLPAEISEGGRVKYEMMEYEMM